MMSNIVKFGNANLPAAGDLSAALRNNTAAAAGSGGQVLLKMDRSGHWVYGADQTEVDREGLWAVNPFSFTHGYIAWGEGEVLSEKMAPITEPLPELEPAPPQAKRGWESQVGMSVKCVHGEDKGVEARYTVTSVGGKKAMHSLAMDVAEQIEMDQAHPVAVVKLGSDHYQHKAYGRVYTPVFDVQKWIGLDGEGAAEEGEAVQAEPTRRRRG
jgi:hypothetical protein